MKLTGTATLQAPVDRVWEAIMDPNVLAATIPGCELLTETGEHEYAATITAGVASIRGTYQGQVRLFDLVPHESLVMHAEGSGAPGTIGTDVRVRFSDAGEGTTQVDYDADAVVGGAIGGVGQRMLTSASKRMSSEFFANIDRVVTGQAPGAAEAPGAPVALGAGEPGAGAGSAAPAPGAAAPPRTFGSVRAGTARAERSDFLKGVLAGAMVALFGVVVGAAVARRR